jgi:hypothetical protein
MALSVLFTQVVDWSMFLVELAFLRVFEFERVNRKDIYNAQTPTANQVDMYFIMGLFTKAGLDKAREDYDTGGLDGWYELLFTLAVELQGRLELVITTRKGISQTMNEQVGRVCRLAWLCALCPPTNQQPHPRPSPTGFDVSHPRPQLCQPKDGADFAALLCALGRRQSRPLRPGPQVARVRYGADYGDVLQPSIAAQHSAQDPGRFDNGGP